MNQRIRKNIIGYLFLMPALILFMVFFLFPILQAVRDSFFEWINVENQTFVGLDNYKYVLSQRTFKKAVSNNIILMIISVFIQIPLAMVLAVFINEKIKGFRFYRTVYFIPSTISTVVVGMIWGFVFSPKFSLINALLEKIGLENLAQNWLGNRNIAFYSISFVNTWQWTGYMVIILLAGLSSVPRDLLDAADIDGASFAKRFFRVVLPLMKQYTEICVLLGITGAMKAMDLIYILTGGGPGGATEVMATFMWKTTFISNLFGQGQAAAVIILFFSVVVTIVYRLVTSERRRTRCDI